MNQHDNLWQQVCVILIASLAIGCGAAARTPTPFANPTSVFVILTAAPSATITQTPTPSATTTPIPSDTPAPTNVRPLALIPKAAATPTRRPTVTATSTSTNPPPTPAFLFKQSTSPNQGQCDAGPGVYEIKGRIGGANGYLGGVHVVLLDKSGGVVAQADSTPPEFLNPEFGVNCFESKNLFSYKLDASHARFNGSFVLRLTKSAGDLTAISPGIPITFNANGGRWYIDFTQ